MREPYTNNAPPPRPDPPTPPAPPAGRTLRIRSVRAGSAEIKPAKAGPAGAGPAEIKSAGAGSAGAGPAQGKPVGTKPAGAGTTPPKPPAAKPSVGKALLALVIKLLVVAVAAWAMLTFVFGVFRLSGNNMYPMLKDGDLCVTYRLETYHSNDVVAYRINGQVRFGRIVARGGDTVDGDEQGVLINGLHPSEEIFYPTQMLETALPLPVTLGDGQCLILNDYRDDLADSRTYGVVQESELEGKVIFIFRRRGF